jgi:hypothetical protein
MPLIPNIPEPLSRAIYADLLTYLPSPAEDTPEARALRDERAVTAVAHLLPENAAEAELAAQIVGAQFHAKDALRCAAAYAGIDPAEVRRCRAQEASTMRQADSGTRTLLRLQAERHKAEDALRPFAMQRAGYWFKPVAEPEPPPEPAAAPEPTELPSKEYGAMTPAERYVTLYPQRAAAILTHRGMPPRPNFPPPDRAVREDLLTSTSPIVREFAERMQAAPAVA